ncbi:amidohydrolase family protein [Bowmanella dokdonensis]|uniref:Amidohydrolase family protein n=1 Tax=Bowmanella dokdonensis TaxID=751969 RepID=A0A939INA8_9ALTE|nr:amidohydrolase family protein [Bowmanella dokdonensis]MBN7826168.1 amidohydrolase family protein [Bowmanella dokdonensis]
MTTARWTILALGLISTFSVSAVEDYLLHNANLIDPYSETHTADGWIQVKGDQIVALGRGTPPDAATPIDLQGAYLLPGLVDGHLHLTAGPLQVSIEDGAPKISMKSDDEVTRFHALAALSSGITSAFSPAGDPIANQAYRDKQQEGQWRGPTLTYAGLTFDPTPIEGGSVYPANVQDWRNEIARQKALGVTHIKLYQGLSETELARGIELAHEAGLKAIAHLDKVSWQVAVDAGVDALTHALPTSADLLPQTSRAAFESSLDPLSSKHLYHWFELVDFDAPPVQRLIRDLADKQVRVDLTLVVNEMMYFYPGLDERYPHNGWQQHPKVAASWQSNLGASLYNWSEQDYQRAQAVFPKVLELMTRLHQAGVPLLIGSDSYSGGPWFWRELALHQQAGLDNWSILQAVTSEAASKLELGNVGRLKPGYQADFVILPANPLDDISAISGLTQVVQKGIRYDVQQLRHELSQTTEQD